MRVLHRQFTTIPALLLLLMAVFLAACDKDGTPMYSPEFTNTPPQASTEIIFGVHPLHNPERLFDVFGPMVDLLNEKIGTVHFRLEASRNYSSFDNKLYSGRFHFALPNPYQTVNALGHNYRVFGKMADDENFRGIFLVRKDSGISRPEQLRGKAVSFPAPTALAATMMPQLYLQQHGIDVNTDIDIRYVGSQESSVMNVFLGNVAAGTTWLPPWRAMLKERPELGDALQVIWQTEALLNNGLVVRKDIDPALVRQVEEVLFNLHRDERGREILRRMELSSFEPATDGTYAPVIRFIRDFSSQVRTVQCDVC